MLSERLLAHELHGKYRDVLELCLYNAVLGGGSLDGKGFSYENKLATYGTESALRSEWYEGMLRLSFIYQKSIPFPPRRLVD